MITRSTLLNYGLKDSTGFWYKDFTLYPIAKTHVRAVLDSPDLFSRDKISLVKLFQKHNEKIGFEGKAREEIILSLVKDGWIRIRHYFKPKDYWAIQCTDPISQKQQIDSFVRYGFEKLGLTEDERIMVNGGVYFPHMA